MAAPSRIRSAAVLACLAPGLAAGSTACTLPVPGGQPLDRLSVTVVLSSGYVRSDGPFEMEPGYREVSAGPDFPAHTRYGDPLPTGRYLAVLEIPGRSQPLEYAVTVE